MFKLATVLLLVAFASAMPQDVLSNRVVELPHEESATEFEYAKVEVKEAPVVVNNDASYAYAVDFSVPVTAAQMNCLKTSKYAAVFVRGFAPTGKGVFDTNSVNTIRAAYAAGLGIEVYMTPLPSSSLQGWQQLDLLYKGLTAQSITIRSVWIQVTSPANWPGTVATHNNFIQSIVARGRQLGLTVGIYTNQYDWSQITGNWNSIGSDVLLWYWHVLGGGVTGETPADFTDFRAFGSWNAPSVKQFAQTESLCSLTVNRDVYAVGIPKVAVARKDFITTGDQIVVGSIGL